MGRGLKNPVDTIVAIATAPGRGGIGVVRISGGSVRELLGPLLGRIPEPRKAGFGSFFGEDGKALDQGVSLFFPRPRSFTGEDVLELQGHGGPVVLQQILSRCVQLGCRIADPGEFSKRAFLNGKLDLAQAEAVADLIDASTAAAARSAVRSLSGEFSEAVKEVSDGLVDLRMLVEASLDFPDEEVDFVTEELARSKLAVIRDRLDGIMVRARRGSLLRSGLHVVLVGKPNVGKSSLMNRLAGEDLAIVTDVPGTTRDTLKQHVEIGGIPVHVVDTAGLRETVDPVEALGIERAWREIERCDAVLYLVDARVGVEADEAAILGRLPIGAPRITVHNKADLDGAGVRRELRGDGWHVWVSAKLALGLDLLKQTFLEVVGAVEHSEDGFLARERHLSALALARSHTDAADALFGQPELFAEELRLGHECLAGVTGEFSSDDLLGEIFSRFCIGK